MALNEWKRPLKELDKLERRNELKRMYQLGDWKLLEGIDNFEKDDFSQVLFGLKSAREIHDFLFECSKENISDSRHYLKIMINYLNLDTRNKE